MTESQQLSNYLYLLRPKINHFDVTYLIIYKGPDPVDFIISTIAVLFVLCVVLFPTDNITNVCNDANFPYSVTILKVSGFRKGFHSFSAAGYLGCLAYMAMVIALLVAASGAVESFGIAWFIKGETVF